jgi:hypothetical protein
LEEPWLACLLRAAGAAQLAIAAGSLAIPRVLGWQAQVAVLPRLTQQVFWTYAGYIWSINVCFGLISITAANELSSPSILAIWLNAFIALYWGARAAIQLFWFDRSELPSNAAIRAADIALTLLFLFLTAAYATTLTFCAKGMAGLA